MKDAIEPRTSPSERDWHGTDVLTDEQVAALAQERREEARALFVSLGLDPSKVL
jgi:hypothetical protein